MCLLLKIIVGQLEKRRERSNLYIIARRKNAGHCIPVLLCYFGS
jgi:hypothetical protein